MKKNKILILGGGFIGRRLEEGLGAELSCARINSFRDAQREISKYRPKIIINCIGSTGKRNVDDCELDKDETLSANTFVPLILVEAALRNKIKLAHISSGCIYHYDYGCGRPISEEKIPDFFGLYYSRTKIYAERALDALSERFGVLIARIRIPLDNRPHPRNILTKLINYKKVITLPNSLTYIPDFIRALRHLLEIDARGIYNLTNKGSLRYPQLMDIYKKYRPDFDYELLNIKQLKSTRTNLILSTQKLEKTGFKVRPIKEVLEECVREYLKY